MVRARISLADLSTTEASLDNEQSKALIYGVLEGYYPSWIRYVSSKEKDLDVYKLAEDYVNSHAALYGLEDEAFYSPTPFHVARTKVNEKVKEETVSVIAEAVIYSNGAVILVHRPDVLLTILYIDEKTVKYFNYPKPS